MQNYYVGSQVRLDARFTNEAGALTNPTTIEFVYRSPSGAVTTLVYPATIFSTGVGLYHTYILLTEAGTYRFRWETTGSPTLTFEDIIEALPNTVEE